jgi:ABC-type bacteriocin/lantibiotic exporter with double-glycine peptidase domain
MLISLLSLCLFAADSQVSDAQKDPRCGSKCLYLALQLLDRPVEFTELERLLGEPSGAGYTLADLEAVARKLGAETLGVQTTFANLARRPGRFACLAHIDGGHFVLFHDVSDGRVSVVDPPRTYELPRDTLQTRWQGQALLLANRPLIPEEKLGKSWLPWLVGAAGLAALAGLIAIMRYRGTVR